MTLSSSCARFAYALTIAPALARLDNHPELSKIFHRVIWIPLDLPSPRGTGELLNYARNLVSGKPYSLMKYCRPLVRKKLYALLQKSPHDVIVCDFLASAGAIPWDWPCAKVLFAHNVEAAIWRRHYQLARNPLWKTVSWFEWKRTQAAERSYFQKADHVLAVSQSDRATFAQFLDPSKLSVTETGVDVEFFRPQGEEEILNSLVFTGSMDWLPNEDGVLYFAREILPLILSKAPDVTLCVVGRNPSQSLQNLAARVPNIQLTGWVEDVRPYLARHAVCIVPLRIGGGTRLKIYEAMSMARAVVSTSIGAEGLPVKHGEHLLVADDAAGFAESTLRLLGDPAYRARLGREARQLVERNYGWTAVAAGFARELESVVQQESHQRKKPR